MVLKPKQVVALLAKLHAGVDPVLAWGQATGQVYGGVTHYIGCRATSSSRMYVCNLCGRLVASESACYPPTKRAKAARVDHAETCEEKRRLRLEFEQWQREFGGNVISMT